MAKFRYVGIEGVDTPAEVYHYGVQFERGEVSEITDEGFARNLESQEGFEKVGDDEETISEKKVKAAKEAAKQQRADDKEQAEWEAKREEELAERNRQRAGQKFAPIGKDGEKPKTTTKGIEDREAKQKDRIHAKSGMTGGNIVGKDDAKPGKRSDNTNPSTVADLGTQDDWDFEDAEKQS